MLAVAGDEEGIVVGEEGEDVGQAEDSRLTGVGGGVDGRNAWVGAGEVCVLDLVSRLSASTGCQESGAWRLQLGMIGRHRWTKARCEIFVRLP